MEYKWKSHGAGIKAQIAGEYLAQLLDEYEGVTPELIVEMASRKSSPIHDCFEWDDKVAAHEHRLSQAQYLLRQLVIVEEEAEIRAFVNVEIEDVTQYISVQTAKEEPELRDQVLVKAYRELVAWKNKYETLKEFFGVVSAIKKLKRKEEEEE